MLQCMYQNVLICNGDTLEVLALCTDSPCSLNTSSSYLRPLTAGKNPVALSPQNATQPLTFTLCIVQFHYVQYRFYDGLNGSKCFRIPTIIRTHVGTLLAFAENRITDCGDNGNQHNLVCHVELLTEPQCDASRSTM